ncbi:MAG: homoserine dehydrogenase [Clostridiales bacterium]|nr:homoserine dehydrogenase [Clostridiales bacterium]
MVKVAILGYGVVGSGVAEVIDKNSSPIQAKSKASIVVKYILDIRDFPGDVYEDKIIKDFSIIESDPEVSIVVETIGGKGVAYDFTKRAILAGKNVVTSNKELVAEHGVELLRLAQERNLNYLFEASVGGGIPIIRPLTQCLSANHFNEISGILNGTTNYILTKMIKEKMSFEDALAEAQEKGYAEKDPTADVEGLDACRKICILADLAYGKHISPSQVYTEGITKITRLDVDCAGKLDCVIKLIGRAVKKDEQVQIIVAPHLVSTESPLSNVEDVFNGIMVDGDAIGNVMFYGRGAGRLPTASAVVADVIDIVKHMGAEKFVNSWDEAPEGYVSDYREMEYSFMVRATSDSLKENLNDVFPGCEIISDSEGAFITPYLKTGDVLAKLEKLTSKSFKIHNAIRILKNN